MKLLSLALAVVVTAAAMPAAAQMFHHHHGPRCHMEYRHHHRVQVCMRWPGGRPPSRGRPTPRG